MTATATETTTTETTATGTTAETTETTAEAAAVQEAPTGAATVLYAVMTFTSRIQMVIFSQVSALEIAKHLKIGLWFEESGNYVNSREYLANLDVTAWDIVQTDGGCGGDHREEYLIDINFKFESDRPLDSLRKELVLFFGDNSSSLADEAGGADIIETADYALFELFPEN